jgi:hypothetical protein
MKNTSIILHYFFVHNLIYNHIQKLHLRFVAGEKNWTLDHYIKEL